MTEMNEWAARMLEGGRAEVERARVRYVRAQVYAATHEAVRGCHWLLSIAEDDLRCAEEWVRDHPLGTREQFPFTF